jgi:hypothetical protein
VDFSVPRFYSRSTRSPLVLHRPDFLASLKLLFFCCVDFAVDICRILLRSLLPAPGALACSQVSSLRFLLPRFFLLVILSASVCFSSWQQGSAPLFTTVPCWEIILRSGSAFRSPELLGPAHKPVGLPHHFFDFVCVVIGLLQEFIPVIFLATESKSLRFPSSNRF